MRCLIDSGTGMTIMSESCAQGLVGSGVADLLGTGKILKLEKSVCEL